MSVHRILSIFRLTLRWPVTTAHPLAVYFFILFGFAVVYRVRLAYNLYHPGTMGPMGFLPEHSSKLDLAAGLFSDVQYAAAWALLTYLAWLIVRYLWPQSRDSRAIQIVLALASILLYAFIHLLHLGTLMYLHLAPGRDFIVYALQNSRIKDYVAYLSSGDLICLTLVGVLYWLNVTRYRTVLIFSRSVLGFIAVIAFPLSVLASVENDEIERLIRQAFKEGAAPQHNFRVARGLKGSPVGHLARQLREWEARASALPPTTPSKEQEASLAFVDPMFTDGTLLRGPTQGQALSDNIVFIQLEAVNAAHALGHDAKGRPYMPYLSSLVGKSLLLNNHRSAGVDTDTASFSIYTGLYPPLNPIHFVSREDIALPTLFSELTPHYKSFLVTSSDAKAWFPRSLLLNTGLQELWDEKTLPLTSRGLVFWRFKDETETAQYFIGKMKSAREPFIALYYPYATHAPYYDYEGASSPEKSNSPYNRYVRNLRLVDGLIERIIRAIDETGLANRTLVAITADHGEAFGEHTESFDHGFTLFEEAVRVPMLFYHPARILPRIVQRPTSHVDILATILDILNRPYDASRFQGESALHAAARRYTFMYSPKSDLIGSVDRNNRKVIASGRQDECEVYDLNADPGEKNPKACDAADPQLQALAVLKRMQTPALRVYQDSCAMTGQCGMHSTWPRRVDREHAGVPSGR